MITLDRAVAQATDHARASGETAYVHRRRGRGYLVNALASRRGAPAVARVSPNGLVTWWARALERYVSVPTG